MASGVVRDIRTRLKIEKDQEYRDSLKSISSGLSVLSSEMKKVTAEFAGNESSMDALRAKGDLLERTLSSQKDKVEVLRQAYEDAARELGESSEATMQWQKKLYDAEAAVYKTEAAIKENNEALEDAGKELETVSSKTTGLGDALDSVADKFGISLPSGITSTLNKIGSLNPMVVAGAAGLAGLAVAAVEAGKKLYNLTTESAEYADEILTLSINTGISTDTLQEWSYAAELIDVDVNTLTGSMTKMVSNMDSARSGSGAAAEAFDRLGISVTDANGELRSAEDVFFEAIDALGEIENSTERDALSMDLFGKSAQDLNSLIVQGSEVLNAYGEEARNVGAVMSNEELAALGEVNDAQQRLKQTQDALKRQIAVDMAPSVATLIEKFSGILPPLVSIVEDVLPAFSVAMDVVAKGLEGVAWIVDKVASGIGSVISTVRGWGGAATNAAGTDYFAGGLTYINENGPERAILPRGTLITTASETRFTGGAGGGTVNYWNVNVDHIEDLADLLQMEKDARRRERMGIS